MNVHKLTMMVLIGAKDYGCFVKLDPFIAYIIIRSLLVRQVLEYRGTKKQMKTQNYLDKTL